MTEHTRLERIVETLESAACPAELNVAICALRTYLGIDHLVYHRIDGSGVQEGYGTYPPEWSRRYRDRNYLRIDPVVTGCFRRFQPVDWKRLDWSSRAARAFRRDSVAHGIGTQGFSVPVRGPHGQFALLTANASCPDPVWKAFTARHRRDLILLAHHCNGKTLELGPARDGAVIPALSPRERDAIGLLAVGLSRAQIAENLAISEHTLRVYVESARFKLGGLNTTHAVARALSHGLIVV